MRQLKILAMLLVVLALASGCGRKKEKQILDIQAEKEQLQAQYQEKDSLLNELFQSMNSIEKNLAEITAREKLITETPASETRLNTDVRERIMDEIIMINNIMEENKKRINLLKEQLRKSDVRIVSLQENIAMLTRRLEEKEAEVASLKEQLSKLNFTVEVLNATIDTLRGESATKSKVISQQEAMIGEMNTVWFVAGPRKELMDKGIIEKAGGLFSGAMKMSELINPDHFSTADMRELTVIPFSCEKMELVTIHPEGSYKILEKDGEITGLEILDAASFWKSSRFLVVITR